jgi:hypothetical protein
MLECGFVGIDMISFQQHKRGLLLNKDKLGGFVSLLVGQATWPFYNDLSNTGASQTFKS